LGSTSGHFHFDSPSGSLLFFVVSHRINYIIFKLVAYFIGMCSLVVSLTFRSLKDETTTHSRNGGQHSSNDGGAMSQKNEDFK